MEEALEERDNRLTRIEVGIQRIEKRQNEHGEQLAEVKVRVLLYGATVGGVGTLLITTILAIATKAIG